MIDFDLTAANIGKIFARPHVRARYGTEIYFFLTHFYKSKYTPRGHPQAGAGWRWLGEMAAFRSVAAFRFVAAFRSGRFAR